MPPHWKEHWTRGLLVLALILALVGGLLLFTAREAARTASRVESLASYDAAGVRALVAGQALLVAGRIDPHLPAVEHGLAVFSREVHTRRVERDSNGNDRTRYVWTSDGTHQPPFLLHAPGGVVRVVNADYALDTPPVRTETDSGGARRRYQGFRPGDVVLLVGTTTTGGLKAETLFGGTRDEYLTTLRERHSSGSRWGRIFLALAMVLTLPPAAGHLLRRRDGGRDSLESS